MAASTAASSIRLNSGGPISPSSRHRRAARSSGGRSRLPTTSVRASITLISPVFSAGVSEAGGALLQRRPVVPGMDVSYRVAGESAATDLDVWDVVPAGGEVGSSLEVEYLSEVVGSCIAHGGRFQAESALDLLQHRGMIVGSISDVRHTCSRYN